MVNEINYNSAPVNPSPLLPVKTVSGLFNFFNYSVFWIWII
ncbi:hypothetical protein MNBD_GAMMA03-1349 [hydrothermal vent metagenome]|uniref:Uncharacterized protein n=1 Tax=hydrothermal vent metagenome TaxID=652676 RepID=A0A3B0W5H4_9ZZZZ